MKPKVKIQITPKEAEKREDSPALALLFLASGVCGLLSFLEAIQDIIYSGTPVYLTAAAVCSLLWFCRRRNPTAFFLSVLTIILGCVMASYILADTLWAQLLHIAASLKGGTELEQMPVTELAVLIAALLSLFLFLVEFLLKGHGALYLLGTALLLLSPFVGVRLSAGSLLLVVLFQGSFWSIQATRQRWKRVVFPSGRGVQKRAAAMVGGLLTAAFLLSCSLASLFSQQLYDPVYDAEGFIYRTLSNISGRANEPITGGAISRGNNYRTGASHLELTASSQPAQTLYLRGFGGGIYTGGDWIRSSDEDIFGNITLEGSWNWGFRIARLYYSMYFVMNQNTLADTPPTPISLLIRHSSGTYENAYVPYYSQRQQNWGGFGSLGREVAGYTYGFYEQTDMHVDWENVDEAFEEERDQYLTLQEAYMAEIQTAYTQVPTDLLPQLTKLVEENPLDDLSDITAFILYTLHSNASYTLTPGWAPLNEDIVEYFLFEGQRGYCVHFAAAASLMYRLYGVPARYATGYRVSPDAFTLQEDGSWTATATDKDAHAWAEIFLPGYGWTPVEVTPTAGGSTAASYPGFDRLEFDRRLQEHRWDMTVPSLTNRAEEELGSGAYEEADTFFPIPEFDWEAHRDLLLIAGTCLVYSLLLLPLFLDYRRLRKQAKMEKMNCRMIFARLLALLRYCGRLGELSGIEPDFAERLSASVPGLSLEDAVAFTEQVKAVAYGPDNGGQEDCGLALQIYRDTAEALYQELPWHRKLVFRWIKTF